MPVCTINEDRQLPSHEDDIWLAWQAGMVAAVSEDSLTPKSLTQGQLWARILASDRGHVPGSPGGRMECRI